MTIKSSIRVNLPYFLCGSCLCLSVWVITTGSLLLLAINAILILILNRYYPNGSYEV